MAKFGVFRTGGSIPLEIFEGDFMRMEKQYVEIRLKGTINDPAGPLVTAIHLDKGNHVTKIKE